VGGLGFGSSKKMTTPEGLVEGSIGWESLARVMVDSQADSWFEQYELVPIQETLQPGAIDADESVSRLWSFYAPFFDGDEPTLAIPGLEIQTSDLGEEIDLTEGVLGPALTATLTDAGVSWDYDTMVPISHAESVELPDLKTTGVSQWGTFFGMPIEQTFKVFRNSKGEETCLWSANLLASTRAFEHITTRWVKSSDSDDVYFSEIGEESIKNGALTFGQWSTKAFIPLLAKRLFYLAETPFPSNVLMSFSRNLAFGEDFPLNNAPRPVLINKPQCYARGAFDKGDGGFLTSGTIMPHVIEMGWTFKTSNQTEIHKILEVVTSGLTRMATILEDGYLNYRTDEYSFPYDDVLLSATKFDSEYVQGENAFGMSYWVPVQRLGFLLNETNIRSEQAVNKGVVKEQEWIAANGAGIYLPNAINSFVYSTLIPAQEWFTIDRLLDSSVRMNVQNESTNSLCNWGIAKYEQGLISEAIEKFELALARDDKYSEAEASYWLALIYEQNDETMQAETYRARCEAAGGYQLEEPVQPVTEGLTKSSNSGLGNPVSLKIAAFCGQCGNQFKDDAAKFCPNCGSAR
jgi:hypothetical protein